jgi:hypothetical protein
VIADWGFQRWTTDFIDASRNANRQVEVAKQLKDLLREVGFVDVHEVVLKLPLNGWPKETHLKHVGMLWQRNMLEGLSAFSLGLFSRFFGRTVEEIEVSSARKPTVESVREMLISSRQLSLVDVRKSLFDRKVHAYHELYVVWGRKPETA